jgi:type II secretory pathway component PulF
MRKFSYTTLAFLFHQLALLTEAGIPIINAWNLLLHDVGNKKQRQSLRWAVRQMEKGMTPSQAMKQAHVFPRLVCTVIVAGEHAGNLDGMFSLLGDYYEYAGKQRRLVIEAVSYPLFLLLCMIALLIGAVYFILPVFEEMFQQMQVPLPAATQWVLHSVQLVRAYGSEIIILAGIVLGAVIWSWKYAGFSSVWEQKMLSCKALRNVYIVWCWQRFSRILSVQIASGIPLLQALRDAAQVVPVQSFRLYLFRVTHAVENGIPLSKAIRGGSWSTVYIETMLTIGETTGKYDEALGTIADYYGWRMELYMSRMQRFLGPVVLVVIGILMGIMVLCLILPLMDMVTGIAV